MSDEERDRSYQHQVNKQTRREFHAFENNPVAKAQRQLDWWWEQKLAARARANQPDAISEYSPVARYDAEADDKETDAGRRYRRGW
jgi:hypothetical protein